MKDSLSSIAELLECRNMSTSPDVLILYNASSVEAAELANRVRSAMRNYAQMYVVVEASGCAVPQGAADIPTSHSVIVVSSGIDEWADYAVSARDYEVPSALVKGPGIDGLYSVQYMPRFESGWKSSGASWESAEVESAIWRLLPYFLTVGRNAGAFARKDELSESDQVAVRAAIEEFRGATETALKDDPRLDPDDERYVRTRLETLQLHTHDEEGGDPLVIERSIADIIRRFLLRIDGTRLRQMLLDLDAEPELVQSIWPAVEAALGKIAEVGEVVDPVRDAAALIESSIAASETGTMLSRLRESQFGQEFQKKLGQSAVFTVVGFVSFVAYRLGSGIEQAIVYLLGAWPLLVAALIARLRSD
jgi:hypothetical protein